MKTFILILSIAIVLGGIWYFAQQQDDRRLPALGSDRDEHGCIGSAGYSWCESKGKCLRPWEESCR